MWNINSSYSNYMYNNRLYFSNYKSVYQLTTIKGIDRVLSTIRISNIPLTVKFKSKKKSEILLLGILYVPGLFTNLNSGNKLVRKITTFIVVTKLLIYAVTI